MTRTLVMRGMTLVEVVVTVAIATVMFAALAALFVNFSSLSSQLRAARDLSNGSSATETMHSAAANAYRIVASHTFNGISVSTGASALALELPAVDTSGSVISGAYDYVGFALSGSTLSAFTDAAAGSARPSGTKLLSSSVASIAFTYNASDPTQANTVTAVLSFEATDGHASAASVATTTARLRNF